MHARALEEALSQRCLQSDWQEQISKRSMGGIKTTRAQKETQLVRDIKTNEETFYNEINNVKKTKETLPWPTATP